jgi:hypothetical protein
MDDRQCGIIRNSIGSVFSGRRPCAGNASGDKRQPEWQLAGNVERENDEWVERSSL